MVDGFRTAAVVVWYQPVAEFVGNLQSYCSFVGAVFVIDNSGSDNGALVRDLDGVTYVPFHENVGIGAALNTGCRMALEKGYEFVMTMDQDSSFEAQDIVRHLSDADTQMRDVSVAVIGPSTLKGADRGIIERRSIITSGSILRLSEWERQGGFNEALFIDQVDHEFCFRLRRSGSKVLLNNSVSLRHLVGDPLSAVLAGIRFSVMNHGWQRKYYIMRNRLYLRKMFPDFPRPYFRMIVNDILGVLLLEGDKMRKINAMAAGIMDFQRGRLGKWRMHR